METVRWAIEPQPKQRLPRKYDRLPPRLFGWLPIARAGRRMTRAPQRFSLIGGPDTGKTNYLFRFWIALRDGRQRELVQDGQPNDAEYLTKGAGVLLSGTFAGHTPKEAEAIEISIKAKGIPASLIVPDRPGEVDAGLQSGHWPEKWDLLLTRARRASVFIRAHSELNVDPLDWIKVQRFFGENVPEPRKDQKETNQQKVHRHKL